MRFLSVPTIKEVKIMKDDKSNGMKWIAVLILWIGIIAGSFTENVYAANLGIGVGLAYLIMYK